MIAIDGLFVFGSLKNIQLLSLRVFLSAIRKWIEVTKNSAETSHPQLGIPGIVKN